MLKITIDLLSDKTPTTQTIAEAHPYNDLTGTADVGNYAGVFYIDETVYAESKVKGHNRNENVWTLLHKALYSMKEVGGDLAHKDAQTD